MTATENAGTLPETRIQAIELMNGMRVYPFKDKLYFRKCMKDHLRDDDGSVLIYRIENDLDGDQLGRGAWCELIGVGPHCKYVTQEDIGMFGLLPELHSAMKRLGSLTEDVNGVLIPNDDFVMDEDAFMEHFGALVPDLENVDA